MDIDIQRRFNNHRIAVLQTDHASLMVTLDAGPRVLHYALKDSLDQADNVFHVFTGDLAGGQQDQWLSMGGHRLWLAPEVTSTYFPDNNPVQLEQTGANEVILSPPAEPLVQKQIGIEMFEDSSTVCLTHRITALEDLEQPVAAWALTVMKAGGTAEVPLPPAAPHPADAPADAEAPDSYLPDRHLALWSYTRLNDARFEWKADSLLIRQQSGTRSLKIGLLHELGAVSYTVNDLQFTKTVAFEDGAVYPDRNSNLEIYTNGEMLELETLSPLRRLRSGESITHRETWTLASIGQARTTS